jgi:hypothetical protein
METNLNELTVAELKEVADANGIELESGARKAEIVDAIANALEETVPAPAEEAAEVEAPAEEAKKEEAPAPAPKEQGTVAVLFKKNVSSAILGKFAAGYHVLDKDLADKWVALNNGKYARVATPKEVADHFSN